jgi:hypothetical protein
LGLGSGIHKAQGTAYSFHIPVVALAPVGRVHEFKAGLQGRSDKLFEVKNPLTVWFVARDHKEIPTGNLVGNPASDDRLRRSSSCKALAGVA